MPGLRAKDEPEVTAYLEAENAYTDAVMKPTEAFQEALYKEMLARIKEDDQSVPYPYGGVALLLAHGDGQAVPDPLPQAARPRRRRRSRSTSTRWPRGTRSWPLGAYAVSDDGRLARLHARLHRLPRVHALREGPRHGRAAAPERIDNVSSVAWAADSVTIFYVLEDDAKRPYRLLAPPAGRAGRRRRAALRGDGRAVPPRRVALAQPGAALRRLAAASPRRRSAGCRPASPPATWRLVLAAREGPRVRGRPRRRARAAASSTSAPTPAAGATSAWWRRRWTIRGPSAGRS